MPSQIVSTTIRSCILNATSNIIAQLITAYKTDAPCTIKWPPVFQFIVFTVLNCPPNFIWQSFLESLFPSHYLTPSSSAISAASTNYEKELDREQKSDKILESKLSIPNTIIKFVLDQTIGAVVNTLLFSVAFAGFEGAGLEDAVRVAKRELWPIMKAGWKLWPVVSLLNYTVVESVDGRNLVGSLAGIGWGIYLSLMKA